MMVSPNVMWVEGNYAMRTSLDSLTSYIYSFTWEMRAMEGLSIPSDNKDIAKGPVELMGEKEANEEECWTLSSMYLRQNLFTCNSCLFMFRSKLHLDLSEHGKLMIPSAPSIFILPSNVPNLNAGKMPWVWTMHLTSKFRTWPRMSLGPSFNSLWQIVDWLNCTKSKLLTTPFTVVCWPGTTSHPDNTSTFLGLWPHLFQGMSLWDLSKMKLSLDPTCWTLTTLSTYSCNNCGWHLMESSSCATNIKPTLTLMLLTCATSKPTKQYRMWWSPLDSIKTSFFWLTSNGSMVTPFSVSIWSWIEVDQMEHFTPQSGEVETLHWTWDVNRLLPQR